MTAKGHLRNLLVHPVFWLLPLEPALLCGCGVLNNPTTQPSSGRPSTSQPSLTWDAAATEVASLPNLRLASNNTPVGGRGSNGGLHVVYTDGSTISHGTLAPGAADWVVRPLTKNNASATVSSPTFGVVQNQLMLTAWTELFGAQRSIVVARSLNAGQTWEAPLLIAQGNLGETLSLYTFTRMGGTPGAVLAWFDADRTRVISSGWQGTIWATSNWTPPVALSSLLFGVSRNPALGGSADTVIAAWEDNRTNTGNNIFIAKSLSGGLSWMVDRALPVPAGTPTLGQHPSVALATPLRVFVVWDNGGSVNLASSADGGVTFAAPIVIGPGQLGHVAANSLSDVAVAWEHFTANATDNGSKSLGLSLSLDGAASFQGPHAVPGSASVFDVVQPSVQLSDSDIDVFWIDVSDARVNVLRHRHGTLP